MTRYARIEDGAVMELLDTDADIATLFPPDLVWVKADDQVQQRWAYDDGAFAEPPAPAFDLEAAVVSLVQERLDLFARTRAYDGILSACTYVTSTLPQFEAEGAYCVQARDAHWATCYQLLAEVQQGARDVPTLDEVLKLLPSLQWPA